MACRKCAEILEQAAGIVRLYHETDPKLIPTTPAYPFDEDLAEWLVKLAGNIRQQALEADRVLMGIQPT